ncbi:MAG: DUF2268 domain-containing putative Zn-dependent protease [Pseudomonadota bacterium]
MTWVVHLGNAQGHFAGELYGECPEPWEEALSDAEYAHASTLAATEWASETYNHAKWFFGAGDLPRWAGYTLGYRLVGRYLAENPKETAASLVNAPAEDFRSALAMAG